MQSIEEKVEALRTVLPLLHVHHPGIRSCIQYERTPSGEPPPPPDPCAGIDCVRCATYLGLDDKRCPPENWQRVKRYYSTRYRTGEISKALDVLHREVPIAAQSVYYQYVEPWKEFNPETRLLWAEYGLHFLATYIRGAVPFHSPDTLKRPWRMEAQRLHAEGLSIRQIGRRLNKGTASIQAAIHGVRIVDGSLVKGER